MSLAHMLGMGKRPLETADFFWALSRQIDRINEILTEFFNDASKRPVYVRARHAAGSVLVLYSIAMPVLEYYVATQPKVNVDLTAVRQNHEALKQLIRTMGKADKASIVKVVEIYSELIRALAAAGLLYRETYGLPQA